VRNLLEVLESSIKLHGEKPLTTTYLANMLRLAERKRVCKEKRRLDYEDKLLDEVLDPNQ
jgi:hypothetical protein